jgi:hypothetical protein
MNSNKAIKIQAPLLDRAMWVILEIAWIAVLILLIRDHANQYRNFDLIFLTLYSISGILHLLKAFVEGTFLTQHGIQHRTWYGKKSFFAYSDLSLLDRKGKSIVLTNGTREVTIGKRSRNFPEAADLLLHKVPNYMSLDSQWQ